MSSQDDFHSFETTILGYVIQFLQITNLQIIYKFSNFLLIISSPKKSCKEIIRMGFMTLFHWQSFFSFVTHKKKRKKRNSQNFFSFYIQYYFSRVCAEYSVIRL